jgi:hypothetical protein
VADDGLAAWDHAGRDQRRLAQYDRERAERQLVLLAMKEPPDPYGNARGDLAQLPVDEQDRLHRDWQEWAVAHIRHLTQTKYPVLDAPADAPTSPGFKDFSRQLAKELRARSGKRWSVRGSRGTGTGWYRIGAPPARVVDGYMTTQDRVELAALLGLDKPVHSQGQQVMASGASHDEFLDRARGYTPRSFGVRDWD